MKELQQEKELPKIFFSLMFILLMIVTCFWIVRPFILGFAWASTVVIATWPLMLKLQFLLWGKRALAIIVMIILLLLLFFIPIALLINSLIDNIGPLITLATSDNLHFPHLNWLQEIPLIGNKLYRSYHLLLDDEGSTLMVKLKPYIGRTTGFFVVQAGHFGRFLLHIGLILLLMILLFWHGEQVGNAIRHFAFRLASYHGDATILLAEKAIRAVALSVVVTALVQSVLGGIGLAISGIPYATFLTVLMILFCLVQVGPLLVLVPAVIWLYWSGDTTWGSILLIWSCMICILDNVLRPILIRMSANLPLVLVLFGVIGGLLSFGMIGIFIGPMVLAVSHHLASAWMHEVPMPNKYPRDVVEK